MKTPLNDTLRAFADQDRVRLHMPGHKGRGFAGAALDVTELPGTDNLHHPTGAIAESQRELARVYGSKAAHILVGGTTVGLIAAILAGTGEGDTVIVPSNSHRSVLTALTLGRICGVFIDPAPDEILGFPGAVTSEQVAQALLSHPDCRGMVLTTPTYYGTVSDTRAIAERMHRAGKWLIVDEAHGAHLAFGKAYPTDAVTAGADVVVQSTHKMLGALTQGSLLHRCSDRIDDERLSARLAMLQSSSPNYGLMRSVERAVAEAADRGAAVFGAIARAHRVAAEAAQATDNLFLYAPAGSYDASKWLYGVRDGSGMVVGRHLREQGIYCELETPHWLLALTGIGTTVGDLRQLIRAVAENNRRVGQPAEKSNINPTLPAERFNQTWPLWRAFSAAKRRVSLTWAEGMISGEILIPYPPGVPVVLPGDRLTAPLIAYVQAQLAAGITVMGVDARGGVTVVDTDAQ
ncbi:aminotransferase class I/II-fold pyridoxal phosphate-dependent enzyme [Pseudoramibacter sp. HA2172]|uniref:aminotransferase class I/II-fold pyridoxal phosphate-dependent enzyme n=1 Tax=Pseudoramibacter faecis TaxID=3108534 RepID=UPI002E76D6B6|nr:aminotransferase class V-fold PLP-dependent enzyme [Pseudoramibacter sp. HA2172]